MRTESLNADHHTILIAIAFLVRGLFMNVHSLTLSTTVRCNPQIREEHLRGSSIEACCFDLARHVPQLNEGKLPTISARECYLFSFFAPVRV